MALQTIFHPTNHIVGYPSIVIRDNKEYAVYNLNNEIMIPETYFPIEQIEMELRNYDMNNINQDKIRSIFCKFKDLYVSQLQIEVEITENNMTNTEQCPLRQNYYRNRNILGENMTDYDLEVYGKADITFDFLKRSDNINSPIPKQFTLRGMKINACIYKQGNVFKWKIGINPSIIYYQLLVLDGAYENIRTSFIEFTDLQQDKFEDMRYYWNIIKNRTENSIQNYLG